MDKAVASSPHDMWQAPRRSNTHVTTISELDMSVGVLPSVPSVPRPVPSEVTLTLITRTTVVGIATNRSHGSRGIIGQLPITRNAA